MMLEQYKIQQQHKIAMENNLLSIHKLYVTIFSAIIALISALIFNRITTDIKLAPKYASAAYGLAIACTVMSLAWLSSWRTCEKKIKAKDELIRNIEDKLPVHCIDLERKYYKQTKVDITPAEGITLIPYIMIFVSLVSAATLVFYMY